MITLVTGGARSGKSNFAEGILMDRKDVVYIATSLITDREMEERVEHHRKSRPSYWRTFEGYRDLVNAIGDEKSYILDCITIMVSNIMFDISKDADYINTHMQRQIEDAVLDELKGIIKLCKNNNLDLILVTNEVGNSLIPENHVSRVFRDIQGRVNQRIASLADQVYLVCCGIPVKIR